VSRLLILLLLAVGLVGCGVAEQPQPAPPAPGATTQAQPRPVRVVVAGRHIDGPLLPEGLGVTKKGGFDNPPVEKPQLGSWYNLGPRPGAPGPAVILGHINGNGKLGLFRYLDTVKSGDRVTVYREDGSKLTFKVYKTQQVVKTEFPTSAVFGETGASELRLISCGGDYDKDNRRYLSNVIAYARLTQT
jgi:LPXTG-site transpeptidase (sortase) family protein